MSNSKKTKRALVMSLCSMLLCLTMLVGSTFAWFTDSVSTGKNTIKAGNLDVDLLYKNADGDYVPVTTTTDLFMDGALWEPGHVEAVNLKVANLGTLALAYKFSVNIAGETPGTNVAGQEFKLSHYIMFAVVEEEKTYSGTTARADALKDAAAANPVSISALNVDNNGVLYPKGTENKDSEAYVTLIVYMPTTVGNEANYRGETIPQITLGVNLAATQTPYEEDSFGNDYDENADYPITAFSGSELVEALKDPADGAVIALGNDVALTSTLSVSDNITLDLGESKVTNDGNKNGINITGDGKNVTIKATTGGVTLQNKNCIRVSAKNSTVTVDGGNYSTKDSTPDPYLVICGVGSNSNNVTIQNVTYTGDRCVQFSDGDNNQIYIKDCTFATTGYSTVFLGGWNNVCTLENVTINSGKIFASDSSTSTGSGEYSVITIKSGTYNCALTTSTNCTISITGGTFSQNPTKYVAEGYQAVKNASGWWDVVPAE